MKLRAHPEIECDLRQAACYLAEHGEDLALAFLAQYDRLIDELMANPLRWPVRKFGIWRALMSRFKYAVYYLVIADVIFVGAVVHLSRDERAWAKRFD